jgi:hypothetical protein
MTRKMKPLTTCANGCGVPPHPPSLVICRACQDKITEALERAVAHLDANGRFAPLEVVVKMEKGKAP